MLKINSYTSKGVKDTVSITLPKEWEADENKALLAQAMRVYTDRSHFGLHQAQTRAQVSRTTKKVYSQKGTGGARHGSRRAPIYVGGGVAHGPTGLSRELTLPKSMRRKVLAVCITKAVKEARMIAGEVKFTKTSEAQKFIDKVFVKSPKVVTFVLAKENSLMNRSLRNISNVRVVPIANLNAYDIFYGGKIVVDKRIFAKEVAKKEVTKK